MKRSNGKMEFTYQYDDVSPRIVMTILPGLLLSEVLEAFEAFLLAAGYSFTGQIEINGNIIDTEQN